MSTAKSIETATEIEQRDALLGHDRRHLYYKAINAGNADFNNS